MSVQTGARPLKLPFKPWQLALVASLIPAAYGAMRLSALAGSLAAAFVGDIPDSNWVTATILMAFTLFRYGAIGAAAGWLRGRHFWLAAVVATLAGVLAFFVANLFLGLPLSSGQIIFVLTETALLALATTWLAGRLQRFDFARLAVVSLLMYLAVLAPVALRNEFQIGVVTEAYYLAIMASSWALLAGVGGQFSFAHMALMAIGAYTSGLLGREFGLSPIQGIVAGTLMAGLVGFVIGVLCLPLRRAYLALFTIAFSEILRIVILTEFRFTGGPNGLRLERLFPVGSGYGNYYTMLLLLLAALALMYALVNSRFGMFWRAIREDEEAAAAMGVDVVRYKLFLFVITSMIAGVAGATFFHTITIITPTNIELLLMSLVIAMAVIGSLEILAGAAIGAFVLHIALESLREIFLPVWAVDALVNVGIPATTRMQFGTWRFVLFGLLLMLTLRFARNGLLYPLFERLANRRRARQETVAKRRTGAAMAADAGSEVVETETP
jgi:branched-chain amino acid transport system permease protein